MCICAYLLYSVEPGKPTFCLANFVAQADMNFLYASVLLKNVQTTYNIGGIETFAPQQIFPEKYNFLPGAVEKTFSFGFQ